MVHLHCICDCLWVWVCVFRLWVLQWWSGVGTYRVAGMEDQIIGVTASKLRYLLEYSSIAVPRYLCALTLKLTVVIYPWDDMCLSPLDGYILHQPLRRSMGL